MRRTSALAVLAITLALTPVSTAAADGARAHHVVLWYLTEPGVMGVDTRYLVAYFDESGEPRDWLFDGLLVTTPRLQNGHTPGASATTIREYKDLLFGGQLAALDAEVAALRERLGDPGFKLHVYLEACYYTGTTPSAQLVDLHDRFERAGFSAIELAGFYWGHQEEVWGSYGDIMASWSAFMHGHYPDLEMLWIPYLNAAGWSGWRSYGVDRVSQQVGYAFADSDTTRFLEADNNRLAARMHGAELEIAADIRNPRLPGSTRTEQQLNNALTYLRAANHYNWAHTDNFGATGLMTYYHGNAVRVYASSVTFRPIYDNLYRFVSQHPRRRAAPVETVAVSGDTFTEHDPGFTSRNNDSRANILVGTNLYGTTGNPARGYLLFDAPAFLSTRRVLAASLVVESDYFPYGTDVVDGQLYGQIAPTWATDSLTGAREPSPASMTSLAALRLHASYASTYSWDITEIVRAQRSEGSERVGFMLKRATESRSERQVALWARESGEPAAHIELVFAGDPPVGPTDGGVPPGRDAGRADAGGPAADGGAGPMIDGGGAVAGEDGGIVRADAGGDGSIVVADAGETRTSTDPIVVPPSAPAPRGCACATSAFPVPSSPAWLLVVALPFAWVFARRFRCR